MSSPIAESKGVEAEVQELRRWVHKAKKLYVEVREAYESVSVEALALDGEVEYKDFPKDLEDL